MFESDIDILKKKFREAEWEIHNLLEQIKANNTKENIVKQIGKNRKAFDFSKKYLRLIPLMCLLATAVATGFVLVVEKTLMMLPYTLIFSGMVSGIFILYSVVNYFWCKHDYNKVATLDNLELENTIDDILANDIKLQQELANMQIRLANYQGLIEYLSEYNDKFTLLEAIKKEDELDIENLFNEYLDEKIDYSNVHFNSDLPEDFQIKTLTNVLK